MAIVRPISGYRYATRDLLSVLAPPYDVISPTDRAALAARSVNNVVHLDLPEGEGDSKYAHAAALLESWIEGGVLTKMTEPALITYEQTFTPPDGGAPICRKGFFALVRVEPYEKRVILPHERTLSGPKEDRYKLFCATKTALSPVFLLYEDKAKKLDALLAQSSHEQAFTTPDGISHRMGLLKGEAAASIAQSLANESLLIADGHHRYETTLRYAESTDTARASAGLEPKPNGAHHYVLSFLANGADPGLLVFPTHRLVHGLKEWDRTRFLGALRNDFDVRAVSGSSSEIVAVLAAAGQARPSVAAVFPDGQAFILTLRADLDPVRHPHLSKRPPALRTADVVVLHAAILEGALGISVEAQAAQTNLTYFKSAADAIARVQAGEGQVLFLMNGTPVETVRRACEAGEVMPQKSTFFYPKVPTGLVFHRLDPDTTP